jgi:hypothetical protein
VEPPGPLRSDDDPWRQEPGFGERFEAWRAGASKAEALPEVDLEDNPVGGLEQRELPDLETPEIPPRENS